MLLKRSLLFIFITNFYLVSCQINQNDKKYSLEELTNNFKENEKEFCVIKHFCDSSISENVVLRLNVRDSGAIFDVSIEKNDSIHGKSKSWEGVSVNSDGWKEILEWMEWDNNELNYLLEKLHKLNCQGILSRYSDEINPFLSLTYGTNDLNLYSYWMFDKKFSEKEKARFEKRAGYFPINENVLIKVAYPF